MAEEKCYINRKKKMGKSIKPETLFLIHGMRLYSIFLLIDDPERLHDLQI